MSQSLLPVVLLAAFFAAGCQPQSPSATVTPAAPTPAIDQAHLCEVADFRLDAVASACKPGQKVVFLPRSWGNEQLPILFAAVNCDLRYAVALTEGAVSCIYNPIQPAPTPPAADASQPADKP